MENQGTSLVSLNAQYASLAAEIMSIGGELTQDMELKLQCTLDALCVKTDGYGVVLEQLKNQSEFWKKQKVECAEAQSVMERAIERLKERMRFVLSQTDGEALQGDIYRFFLCRTKPTLVLDDTLLPAAYKKTQMTVTPDRDAIETSIALGNEIPGVTVQENKALRQGRPK